jgi:hypothetical protein
LPVDSTNGWSSASYVLASARDLWIQGGAGPIYLRHYGLSGSPLPTSATLVSTQVFGDSDSRPGDVLNLASGGLVSAWHQQGATGPQGLAVAYRSPAGAWQSTQTLDFMATNASKQVLAQHPTDASVWLFNDPDAWSAIGAVHLTEVGGGLRVDWTNSTFLASNRADGLGPDLENPDLAVAPDPFTGTIALAYESATRKTFSTNPTVTGSYVAVARIAANQTVTMTSLNTYVERISSLGLTVRGGETWLAYRPVDTGTLTYDHLYVSHQSGGTWAPPVLLGHLYGSYERVGYTASRPEFSTRLDDGGAHFFTVA